MTRPLCISMIGAVLCGITQDTVGMESLKMAVPKQLQVIAEFDGRNFHLWSTQSSRSSILAQEVST